MKKITVLILLSLIVFGFSTYAEDSISGEALQELGLIQGDNTGLNESGVITREALVKMAVSLTADLNDGFQLPETPTFNDVPKDHWAYSWVERAYASNLTKGIGGGAFGLSQNVTQQQVAAFMLNILNESYDYSDAVKTASAKGISTKVIDNFNRGNSFEMVAKTLLMVPVGQEKPLFETNKNYKGKNFKQIVSSIELRRDEAKKVAEAIAAEAAKKAKEAKIAAQAKTMAVYRSTWPNKIETYLEWLVDIENILEPSWVEISYDTYDTLGDSKIFFDTLQEKTEGLKVEPKKDCTLTVSHFISHSDDITESKLVKDVKFYYAQEYDAFKFEGYYNGSKVTMLYMNDSNSESRKGFIKVDDTMWISRVSNYHFIAKEIDDVRDELNLRESEEGFESIEFKAISNILKNPMTLNILCQDIVKLEKSWNIRRVGFDTYDLLFNTMTSKSLTIKKNTDGLIEVLDYDSIFMNSKGDLIKINGINEANERILIYIELDENNHIEKIFFNHNYNNGAYVAK